MVCLRVWAWIRAWSRQTFCDKQREEASSTQVPETLEEVEVRIQAESDVEVRDQLPKVASGMLASEAIQETEVEEAQFEKQAEGPPGGMSLLDISRNAGPWRDHVHDSDTHIRLEEEANVKQREEASSTQVPETLEELEVRIEAESDVEVRGELLKVASGMLASEATEKTDQRSTATSSWTTTSSWSR